MSPQRSLSRRRLSAVALIILAGATYPAGPIDAQMIFAVNADLRAHDAESADRPTDGPQKLAGFSR